MAYLSTREAFFTQYIPLVWKYVNSFATGWVLFPSANATCLDTQCSEGLSCLINPVNHQPLCAQCKTRTCSPLSRYKVCGTDGVDYKNYCFLMKASCKMVLAIDTRHSGSCDSKLSLQHPYSCTKSSELLTELILHLC